LTIPCHMVGEVPVGMAVFGLGGQDQDILSIGQGVEAAFEITR
jgi:Asp-tRNA(Asn)/Glu-tRNA(Gln) amidotransferase A subunit family amidase